MINAHEGISVQTFDVPGAYIHASLPDDKILHTKFEGEFVDIMCEVNPEYENFVRYDLQSTINVQVFFGFHRKLARMKTQPKTDKASKHNGRNFFVLRV